MAEMTLGARLDLARERAHVGKHELSRLMTERGVRGSSYPTILRYLRDEGSPSGAFLREAAMLLDCDLEWLQTGEGWPGVEEEEIARLRASVRSVTKNVERAVGKGLPEYESLGDAAKAVVWKTCLECGGRLQRSDPELSNLEVARRIGKAIGAPLRALGVSPDRLPRRELDNYVMAICLVLLAHVNVV